ncbi:hypothetical protein KHQ82_01205 [Mycoplasmatota bacterium]|nr:hypothetical protein KHQ82_01205 [Mycoplasmatota bacterium]
MKKLNFNKVKDLMDELDVDFKVAKKALRKSRGNYDGAVFYIKEWKRKKVKINNDKLNSILENIFAIFKYKLEAKKDDKVVLSLNILVILVVTLLLTLFSYSFRSDMILIIFVIMLVAMYYKIEISLLPSDSSFEEIFTINRDLKETQESEETELVEEEDGDFNEIEV